MIQIVKMAEAAKKKILGNIALVSKVQKDRFAKKWQHAQNWTAEQMQVAHSTSEKKQLNASVKMRKCYMIQQTTYVKVRVVVFGIQIILIIFCMNTSHISYFNSYVCVL